MGEYRSGHARRSPRRSFHERAVVGHHAKKGGCGKAALIIIGTPAAMLIGTLAAVANRFNII